MSALTILLLIFLVSTFLTIFLILKKPSFNFKIANKVYQIDSYFLGAMLGPILIILFKLLDFIQIGEGIKGSAELHPLGIITLFLSLVFISVFLDFTGFFDYCAKVALRASKNSGKLLFIFLYFVAAFLTIFTVSDIVILTFTPFIYYFTKNADLDPFPFLIALFFSTNTWTTMLFIGNTTNILLATAFNISFDQYFKWMFFPTLFGGLINFILLYFLFRKQINKKTKIINVENPRDAIKDPLGVFVGLTSLILCLVMISFSQKLGVATWTISIIFALILLGFVLFRDLIKVVVFKKREKEQVYKNWDHHIKKSMTRATLNQVPWAIIPFIFSLFITVYALNVYGVTEIVGQYIMKLIGTNLASNIFLYGYGSAIFANVLNNIPMSIAAVSVINVLSAPLQFVVALAVIIGSNLGANLTPIGALAGIMWVSILKTKDSTFSITKFIKYGVITTVVSLFVSLLVLFIEAKFFFA